MKRVRIVLYGHFGSGNVGNDSSLEAALYNIKRILPQAEIICVCNGPHAVAERFDIETIPITESESKDKRQITNFKISRIKRVLVRVIDEFEFWIKRPNWFKTVDLFIIVGTGAVDDMAVRRPWHAPYELYKWCKCAKLGGVDVVFLSVGVGPIVNRLNRFLMLKALRLADYRSYRETAAEEYLKDVGFDTNGDFIYPDLVFSLNRNSLIEKKETIAFSTSKQTVGLGLINYYGWKHDEGAGEPIYQVYISKLKRFVSWLLENDYQIRLLIGDQTDRRPLDELIAFVKSDLSPPHHKRVIADEILNVDDLFKQIAQSDIVIASRFHNVLCSLMLERPVISLGYHEKNDLLMEDIGLRDYCQHIEHFSLEWLIEQFNSCIDETDQIVRQIHNRLDKYRGLLDDQYKLLLSRFEEF